jgi:hypothetical protein
MNAAEHIVDSHFRIVRDYFTLADQKVLHGNNRQLDLLAQSQVEGVFSYRSRRHSPGELV